MSDNTKIEWADATWSPITGCTPISDGCEHCYAKRLFGRNLWDYDFTPGTFHEDRLTTPLRWKNPRRIFVCSMGDLFHEDVPYDAIRRVLAATDQAPQHTYMLLTKRPGNMLAYCKQRGLHGDNIWLGVTAEDQAAADERIPVLLDIPAAVRFVSCEPLLGPVNLDPTWTGGAGRYGRNYQMPQLDWVIAGPETGPGKRECKAWWIYNLREQCQTAAVPFFLKKTHDGQPVLDAQLQQFPEVHHA